MAKPEDLFPAIIHDHLKENPAHPISWFDLSTEASSHIIKPNIGTYPPTLPAVGPFLDMGLSWGALQAEILTYPQAQISQRGSDGLVSFADDRLRMYTEARQLYVDGQLRRLERQEYNTLLHLGQNAGNAVSTSVLQELNSKQGPDDWISKENVWSRINTIRRKLGSDELGDPWSGAIQTIRCIGYRAIN